MCEIDPEILPEQEWVFITRVRYNELLEIENIYNELQK